MLGASHPAPDHVTSQGLQMRRDNEEQAIDLGRKIHHYSWIIWFQETCCGSARIMMTSSHFVEEDV